MSRFNAEIPTCSQVLEFSKMLLIFIFLLLSISFAMLSTFVGMDAWKAVSVHLLHLF